MHILEKHIPSTPTTVGKGTLFPNIPLEEVKSSIVYVLNNSVGVASKDNLIFDHIVQFSDGSSSIVRVAVDKTGKILSAYPLK